MVLPSNSSMRYFPDNTTTSFITELPQTIRLHGEWEVALSEIQFPSTFFHIRRNENQLGLVDIDPTIKGEKTEPIMTKEVVIPNGVYKNIEDLIEVINKVTKQAGSHIRLEQYREGKIMIELSCTYDNCNLIHYLHIPDNLMRILGLGRELVEDADKVFFKKLTVTNPDSKGHFYTAKFIAIGARNEHNHRSTWGFVAHEPTSLARGIPDKLFVYCDICEPYIVGDVQSPLLRIVPVETHGENYVYGANQVKHFSPPHYIPLRQTNFRRIEIDIKDELGKRVPFESGTLTVTLHFRRFQ